MRVRRASLAVIRIPPAPSPAVGTGCRRGRGSPTPDGALVDYRASMTDHATQHPDLAYEDWPYEDLRDAAFERARQRHDLQFFIDLMAHTPALTATADEGGSLGEIGGSFIETIEAAKQVFSHSGVGDLEPLFVAVFSSYLRDHPES